MAEKKKAKPEAEEVVEEVKEETVSKTEFDALNDSYLRLLAEFTNFKKRTEKEKQQIYGDATVYVVKNLLTVKDTLELAAAQDSSDEEYKKGVTLTLNSFNSVFSSLGVEEINPLGEEFDPALHNAVMTEENEEFGENTVSAVLQKGYKLNDRVIRPAMVKVANS
jgi:molecular chaperone GrpE